MDKENPPIDMDLVRRSVENRAMTLHAIGQFIFEFSQLEFTIRFVLAAYLDLPDGYFDAVTGPYDFRMLCAVTSKVGCLKFPERAENIEKLFKECQALNDKRVHIAHGLWNDGIGEEFSVRVFSRQKLDATHYPHSSDELHELANKAQDLMQRVMGFQAGASSAPSPA
jgi:hypothetical protein